MSCGTISNHLYATFYLDNLFILLSTMFYFNDKNIQSNCTQHIDLSILEEESMANIFVKLTIINIPSTPSIDYITYHLLIP